MTNINDYNANMRRMTNLQTKLYKKKEELLALQQEIAAMEKELNSYSVIVKQQQMAVNQGNTAGLEVILHAESRLDDCGNSHITLSVIVSDKLTGRTVQMLARDGGYCSKSSGPKGGDAYKKAIYRLIKQHKVTRIVVASGSLLSRSELAAKFPKVGYNCKADFPYPY